MSTEGSGRPATERAERQARAWLWLDAALALHVTDEALTGFLDFYNPLVRRIRETIAWFPMPTFTFGSWLAGLIALVVLLAALSPVIRRHQLIAALMSWILAVIMFGNGIAHLAGSLYFGRWLPGATSAPVLLLTSALLMRRTIERGRITASR